MSDSTTSDKLNYSQSEFTHPSYKFSRILPQSGGQTVTVSSAGGQESIFEIPISVINFPRSEITYKYRIPEGANTTAIWEYKDAISHFAQLQLYTRGGDYICNIPNCDKYHNIVNKTDTKMQDFLAYDRCVTGATAPAVRGSSRHLQVNNSINTANAVTKRFDNSQSNLSYIEAQYLNVATAVSNTANAGDVYGEIKIPLDEFKNTVFAYDKDLYFGEILLLRIVWNQSTKIYFQATAVDNPAGGAAVSTGASTDVSISSLQLLLCTEKNEVLKQQLARKKETGMSLLIPYVHSFKNLLNGTSQTVSIRFNRGQGKNLQKIYHAVYNATENKNLVYDHTNITAAGVPGEKIIQFYTMLNNNRLQEFDIVTANYDDYLLMRNMLKGSVLQNSNVYGYNHVWIEDFVGELSQQEKDKLLYQNLDAGLDLTLEQKWDIYLTMEATGANRNHYSFAVTQRVLTVGPSGISVV